MEDEEEISMPPRCCCRVAGTSVWLLPRWSQIIPGSVMVLNNTLTGPRNSVALWDDKPIYYVNCTIVSNYNFGVLVGRDQLWWRPMLAGHRVRTEEADMAFETQAVMIIDQMLRLMSPRASRGLLAVLKRNKRNKLW